MFFLVAVGVPVFTVFWKDLEPSQAFLDLIILLHLRRILNYLDLLQPLHQHVILLEVITQQSKTKVHQLLFLVLTKIEKNGNKAVFRKAIEVKHLICAALFHPLNWIINQGPIIELRLTRLVKDLQTSSWLNWGDVSWVCRLRYSWWVLLEVSQCGGIFLVDLHELRDSEFVSKLVDGVEDLADDLLGIH